MKHLKFTALMAAMALLAMLGASLPAAAEQGRTSMKATLKGFEEVPANSTTGRGEFRATISRDGSSIEFELTYENLKGPVTSAAHIHLGQKTAAGGVSVFLCGGGGRPACTPTSGRFTGTITAANVEGPVMQGITAGALDELVAAMRKGFTYANVHTTGPPGSNFPMGEIRGQIKAEDDGRDDD